MNVIHTFSIANDHWHQHSTFKFKQGCHRYPEMSHTHALYHHTQHNYKYVTKCITSDNYQDYSNLYPQKRQTSTSAFKKNISSRPTPVIITHQNTLHHNHTNEIAHHTIHFNTTTVHTSRNITLPPQPDYAQIAHQTSYQPVCKITLGTKNIQSFNEISHFTNIIPTQNIKGGRFEIPSRLSHTLQNGKTPNTSTTSTSSSKTINNTQSNHHNQSPHNTHTHIHNGHHNPLENNSLPIIQLETTLHTPRKFTPNAHDNTTTSMIMCD